MLIDAYPNAWLTAKRAKGRKALHTAPVACACWRSGFLTFSLDAGGPMSESNQHYTTAGPSPLTPPLTINNILLIVTTTYQVPTNHRGASA